MRLLWIFRTLRINFSWTIKLQAKIFSALIFICYPQRFTQPTFNQCSTYIVPKKIRKPPVFWFFPGYRSGTSIENRLRKEVHVNCIQRYIEDPAVHLRCSVLRLFTDGLMGFSRTPFVKSVTYALQQGNLTQLHNSLGGLEIYTNCMIYTFSFPDLSFSSKIMNYWYMDILLYVGGV